MNENKIVNVSPYLVTEKRDKLLKDCDHEYVTKRGCFDIIDNEVHSENNYESSLCCEMLSLPTFKCLHCTRLLTAPMQCPPMSSFFSIWHELTRSQQAGGPLCLLT